MPKIVQHIFFWMLSYWKWFFHDANITFLKNVKMVFFWKLCSLSALVWIFSAWPGAARYALAIPLACCEALSFDENFSWTEGRIREGCRAKILLRHKIGIFEYQTIISENGAYCAARRDTEVECNMALVTIRARLMSNQFGFVGFMKVQAWRTTSFLKISIRIHL